MGFWITHRSAPLAMLAMLGAGVVACSSSVPTGPSALSSVDQSDRVGASISAASAAAAGGAQLAAADTIKITQGLLTLESNHPGTITLRGSHGFTFEGRTLSGVDPSNACGTFGPCFPGDTVNFTATWSGLDLPGTARLGGTEFTDVGGLNSPSSLTINLTGSFVAPPQAETATIIVPFSVGGLFVSGNGNFDLTGSGNVTFTLTWQTNINGWAITSSSFDFGGGGGKQT
jgi:hypothetical protein